MVPLIMAILYVTLLLWSQFMCWYHNNRKPVSRTPTRAMHVLLKRNKGMHALIRPNRALPVLKTPKKALPVFKCPDNDFRVVLSYDAASFTQCDSTTDLLIYFLEHGNIPGHHKQTSSSVKTKSEPCFYRSICDGLRVQVASRLTKSESNHSKSH